jgi:glutathione synthase/RimK-type ligase-like ATP-grasp enzyme
MTVRILTNSSFPSAKLLSVELQGLINDKLFVTKHPERVRSSDKLIRYGNSESTESRNETGLNSSSFISLVANKGHLAKLLEENNFYAPKFFLHSHTPESYPVVVRETLSSFGGRGIHVCQNINQFNSCTGVWTPFVHTAFELRVHVMGGEVKRIFKKEFEGDGEDELPIRNLDRGYHFSLKENENYPKVVELFKKISNCMNIGKDCFFAGDIGWDSAKKEYFIFEFNSAPGLNENTARVYAEFLAERI